MSVEYPACHYLFCPCLQLTISGNLKFCLGSPFYISKNAIKIFLAVSVSLQLAFESLSFPLLAVSYETTASPNSDLTFRPEPLPLLSHIFSVAREPAQSFVAFNLA